MGVRITAQGDGSVLLAVKVAPGSSRDRIVGPYGEALKIAVSAPAEGGKANKALCRLLARALGVPVRNVTVRAGGGSPLKTLRVAGLDGAALRDRLGLH